LAFTLGRTRKSSLHLPTSSRRSSTASQPPYGPALDVGESGFEAPKPLELLVKPEERWYRHLLK
jgi:hypothetical protein